MKIRLFFHLLGLFALGVSCTSVSSEEDMYALALKKNPALRHVLELYEGDSLKQQAALFLISNLACHEGVASGDMGAVYKAYELFGTGKFTYQQALDSAAKVCGFSSARNITMKKDIYIDPAYLVTNIEWAFKVWREQPWGKNVPFGQFCEYVLPYRVGNEELVPWREKLYYQFMPIIEKHKNDSDIVKSTYAAHLVLDSLLRAPFYFTGEMGTNIRIGSQIADWRGGSCLDLCDMMVYICRALGIPCGIEELPMRGNNNAPHYWNFIEDQDGKTWYFSMFYWWHRLMEAEKYADVYGKVFRHRFSLNWDMMYSMQTDAHFVHPEFRLPCFEDVTRLYATDKSHTLTIGKEHFTREMGKDSLVYLCMSNRYDWKPVGWCRYDGQAAVFNDCHGGTVYCLASYDAGSKKLVTLSHPFSVDVDSAKMEFYEPEKETEDVVLFSKFGMIGEFFLGRMVGGVFEGSRSPGFEHPDTLFRIKDMPLRLCTAVRVDSTKAYRYVRYFGPRGGFGNVSEVGFYSSWADTEPLKGDILGPQEGAHGSHSYFNVFDGHTDTSYDHPFDYGGWAGLDLGEKKAIGKIVYTPRNRDNFVRKDDLYELLVCHGGEWKSAGTQVAQSDSLLFRNIPKHALLLLRDLSRGEAERLFEYKDGVQKYW